MSSTVVAPEASSVAPTSAELRSGLLLKVEDHVRRFLAQQYDRWSSVHWAGTLLDAVDGLIAAGGKRIRPAFCISGFLASGGDPQAEEIVPVAGALEMLHVCALIHDDVMDAASRRRNAPTVHCLQAAEHHQRGWRGESRRFGEGVAILAGDLALVYSDQLMLDASSAVRQLWAELRSELIMGQHVDLTVAAQGSAEPQICRWIALAKSGRYTIHRPLEMGALLAGRPDLAPAFATYGAAIGEAFQLRDDLIDVFGDDSVTGKPGGLDLEQDKMTLLFALAVQRDARFGDLLSAHRHDLDRFRKLLVESGIRHDVESHISRLLRDGCEAIMDAPLSAEWQQDLVAMARAVVHRNK